MRILMFGRGVIATIYGNALRVAGHDVQFYVRPGRAAEYGDVVDLDLIDARRKRGHRRVRENVPVSLRESIDPADGFDLVVLSVSHHRLAEAAGFLAPLIGHATVLVFGNVWDAAATARLPADRVVFGFPLAGGGFGEDGVLHGAVLRSVIVGRSGATSTPRELAVQDAFREAGFGIRTEADMRGWLRIHFVADAGMFAQGLQSGALAGMVGDRAAFRGALLTARELLPILTAHRVDLRRHWRAALPFRMSGPISAVMAWVTARVPMAQASLLAHTEPYGPEARAILQDALRETRRLGIRAPRLEAALEGRD
jgi:2-dehydropantoate 2-reductase